MAVWKTIFALYSSNLFVGAHEDGRGIAELKYRLLKEQLNRPGLPTGTDIKQPINLHSHSPGFSLRALQTEDALQCDPEDVVLSDFPQWKDEKGYWIGDYDYYQSDGEPNKSEQWPYPYKQYRGFITGNTAGNAYRQRNVFVYRPLPAEECDGYDESLVSTFHGTCGTNGNTKLFKADQKVTTCSESAGGSISGPYAGVFFTKTDLIGNDDALLYQVSLLKDALGPSFPPNNCLFQSQLTTITRSSDGEQVYRTRSAQSFECFNPVTYGQPTSLSFYRERKVDRQEFVTEMQGTFSTFNVTTGDTCAWESSSTGAAVPSPYYENPGIGACLLHLDDSFELGDPDGAQTASPTAGSAPTKAPANAPPTVKNPCDQNRNLKASFEMDINEVARCNTDGNCEGYKGCTSDTPRSMCQCKNNKCKRKWKDCKTHGQTKKWLCPSGKVCIAELDSDCKPKNWGTCDELVE